MWVVVELCRAMSPRLEFEKSVRIISSRCNTYYALDRVKQCASHSHLEVYVQVKFQGPCGSQTSTYDCMLGVTRVLNLGPYILRPLLYACAPLTDWLGHAPRSATYLELEASHRLAA